MTTATTIVPAAPGTEILLPGGETATVVAWEISTDTISGATETLTRPITLWHDYFTAYGCSFALILPDGNVKYGGDIWGRNTWLETFNPPNA